MALALSYADTAWKTGSTGTTLASNSFSPAAGDVVYVIGWIDALTGGAITESTPTNSGTAVTWTLVTRNNAASGGSLRGVLFAYRASFTSGQSGITVTISGGASGAVKAVAVAGFTGADSAQAGAATGNQGSSAAPSLALTTTQAGSWIWAALADYTTFTSSWAAGTGFAFQIGDTNDGSGDTINLEKENPQPSSGRASGTNITAAETGVTGDFVHFIAWEVLPAAAASTTANAGLAAGAGTASGATPALTVPAAAAAAAGTALGVPFPANSPALELSGFGAFTGIGASDTINTVTVAVAQFSGSTAMAPPTFELWDGGTAIIGVARAGNNRTSSGNVDTATFTGVTYSQLAGLRVRVYAHSGTAGSGTTASVDAAWLTVTYTPSAGSSTTAPAGLATGTGTAPGATVQTSSSTTASAQLATATGTAQQATAALTAQAGLATAAGTAQQPSTAIAFTAQAATAAGTAGNPAVTTTAAISVLSVTQSGVAAWPVPRQIAPQVITGQAAPPAAVTANAGLASAAGAAPQPSAALTTPAGPATGTGIALQPAIQTSGSTTANAGLATGTGTASAATAAVTAPASLATGTGTALQPAVSTSSNVTAQAHLATAAGAATTATTQTTATATAATGTGAAPQPAPAVTAPAATAASTGTAPAATAHPAVTAHAGLATATATASTAALATLAHAETAAALAAALDATVPPQVIYGTATPGGTTPATATPSGTTPATATPGGRP